jgi:hypothetical protein
MARSISEIQASMAATRAELAALGHISTPSATGILRLIEYVVAVGIWVHETLWDRFAGEIADTIRNQPPGTPEWYAQQALAFQLGDEVVVLESGKAGYEVPLPAYDPKRIIARAAVRETSVGKVSVKVAGYGPTPGSLQPLSPTQLAALARYFDRVRFAGTPMQLGSFEADRLRVYGTVYHNVMLAQSDARAAVQQAIRAYLANIPFDGRLQLSRLVDAVQAVEGIKDFVVSKWQVRAGFVVSPPLGRDYDTQAGYVYAEDGAGLTGIVPDLEETLAYLASADAKQ